MYAEVLTIEASEDKHKSYTLKQSEHALKIDDQNLRLIKVNSDSEQEHVNPSHQYSEASSASKEIRF